MKRRTYIAIDLKSFYASVECRAIDMDPLDELLVVADESRSDRTICLAVSPALKAYGVPGRDRLFAVRQVVDEVNRRRKAEYGRPLCGTSTSASRLRQDPSLAMDIRVAMPHMARYMDISARIYSIYLRYISSQDMHVYSIDEVFIDATDYLGPMGMDAQELARTMIRDVMQETGITATAGIGDNLYLCKVAMDILAKKAEADEYGVRIASLDEASYRRLLWDHEPITDFWRIGRGYAARLAANGMYTMGDVALCSLRDEELLYRLFGVNAELLIDHAWGWESCTMKDIHDYRPSSSSIGQGQVLMEPYTSVKARLVLGEMADALAMSLVDKGLVTRHVEVMVGYDIENLRRSDIRDSYHGQVKVDHYGRSVPSSVHAGVHTKMYTSSSSAIRQAAWQAYDSVVDPALLVRRLNISACGVVAAGQAPQVEDGQMDLFTDYEEVERQRKEELALMERERRLQDATLEIRRRWGGDALLRLSSYEEGATARERSRQIGGHRA